MALTFPDILKAWRKAKGFSQHEAAEKLGISRSYLNQIEKGRRAPGKRLVNTLGSLSPVEDLSPKIEPDYLAALESLAAKQTAAELKAHVKELMGDASRPIEEILRIANAIMPIIHRKESEIESQILESRTSKDLSTVARGK